jgi:hypothetical protein
LAAANIGIDGLEKLGVAVRVTLRVPAGIPGDAPGFSVHQRRVLEQKLVWLVAVANP